MSSYLTSGIPIPKRTSQGGIKNVYITELDHKDTLTEATEGLISTFTLTAGNQFWTYNLEKNTGNYNEAPQMNRENGSAFYQTTLNIVLNNREVTKRNQIRNLAKCRLMIIIEDRAGKYWLMGEENGAMLEPSASPSGTAMGDRNGYELVFIAEEADMMSEVDSSLIAALTTAAS